MADIAMDRSAVLELKITVVPFRLWVQRWATGGDGQRVIFCQGYMAAPTFFGVKRIQLSNRIDYSPSQLKINFFQVNIPRRAQHRSKASFCGQHPILYFIPILVFNYYQRWLFLCDVIVMPSIAGSPHFSCVFFGVLMNRLPAVTSTKGSSYFQHE